MYSLFDVFRDGGVFMYPLALCSLFALGVIIAKAYTLRFAHRNSREVLTQADALMKRGDIDAALKLTADAPGPVAAVLYAGLRRIRDRQTDADIEAGVKTTGIIELGFLERGLVGLATVSNVAPLLGFLGTVAGMITAFGAIAAAGAVEASLVAGGIKVALITTAAGLIIAIPVNVAYNYFVTRIDRHIIEMEQGKAALLNTAWALRPVEAAGAAPGPARRPARRRRNRASGEIPTASMADIAFLLLIFFLVTTVFDEERGLPVVLPAPAEAIEVAESDVLHLTVQADGMVDVQPGADGTVQRVAADDIAGIWQTAVAGNPNLVASLETASDAPYHFMVAVLDELQGAGASRISLQMRE